MFPQKKEQIREIKFLRKAKNIFLSTVSVNIIHNNLLIPPYQKTDLNQNTWLMCWVTNKKTKRIK